MDTVSESTVFQLPPVLLCRSSSTSVDEPRRRVGDDVVERVVRQVGRAVLRPVDRLDQGAALVEEAGPDAAAAGEALEVHVAVVRGGRQPVVDRPVDRGAGERHAAAVAQAAGVEAGPGEGRARR